MKPSNFKWQWNDGPIWSDPSMTRSRASVLLRAWRRQARQPANYKNVYQLTRIDRGVYRVASTHGESGTMILTH